MQLTLVSQLGHITMHTCTRIHYTLASSQRWLLLLAVVQWKWLNQDQLINPYASRHWKLRELGSSPKVRSVQIPPSRPTFKCWLDGGLDVSQPGVLVKIPLSGTCCWAELKTMRGIVSQRATGSDYCALLNPCGWSKYISFNIILYSKVNFFLSILLIPQLYLNYF